jgi:hypothetical protein
VDTIKKVMAIGSLVNGISGRNTSVIYSAIALTKQIHTQEVAMYTVYPDVTMIS